MSNAVASFGWEVKNLDNNGADLYFKATKNMVLNSVNIDVSFMITALAPAGFSEVLCQGAISRGGPPAFGASVGPAFIPTVTATDFGPVTLFNPNKLNLVFDSNLYQDKFYSVILKSWVPDNGAASSASRHVQASPSLSINSGDYLIFHIDHAGVSCDAEMQVVLAYSV